MFHSARVPAVLAFAFLACGLAGCPPAPRHRPVDPAITSIAPRAGPRTGGTVVRVEGSGFGTAPFVTLGGADVQEFLLVTDSAIEFRTPPDVVGPAALAVFTASGGRRTVLDAYFYEPLPARAYAGRWFADASDAAGANVVVVTSAGTISSLDMSVAPMATGSIAGRLTDAAGAPIVGHAVVAQRLDGAFPPVAFPSGLDGAYRLEGLPPGAWLVRTAGEADAELADQAWDGVFDQAAATAIDVIAGAVAEGVDFALSAGGAIDGRVFADGTGAGIEGATVFALSVPADPFRFAYAVTAGTDGAFAMRGLSPGDYRLIAFAFGTGRVNEYYEDALTEAGATLLAVAAGGTVTADFALDEAGAIAGSVTEQGDLGPLPYVAIVAHDVVRGLDHSTSTGVDGTYRLQGLPAGSYRLEAPELGIYLGGVTTTAGSPVVGVLAGAEETGKNFLGRLGDAPCADPPSHGTVSGLVLGAGGATVLRATVLLLPIAGGAVGNATVSGLDGKWTANCLVPGDYQVRVIVSGSDLVARFWSSAGAGGAPTTFTVTAGASVLDRDVALARGAKLEGRVRDAATNAPLGNVPVRVTNGSTGEARTTVTGPDGRWAVDRASQGGLAPGNWKVEARPHLQAEFAAP